jgi:hypothetical protein
MVQERARRLHAVREVSFPPPGASCAENDFSRANQVDLCCFPPMGSHPQLRCRDQHPVRIGKHVTTVTIESPICFPIGTNRAGALPRGICISERRTPVDRGATRFIPDTDIGAQSPVSESTLRLVAHNYHELGATACF